MSLAKANISGTVITDVEKRHTPNGHGVTNFTIETANLNTKQPGTFQIKVTCWRGLAEGLPSQVSKGDTVLVEGKLMVNQEAGSPAGGMQNRFYEIEATNVYKVAGPVMEVQSMQPQDVATQQPQQQQQYAQPQQAQAAMPQQQQQAPQQPMPQQQAVPAGGFSSDDLLTEDDIPF